MTTVACFCLEKAGLLKRRQVVIEAICGCQRLCTKIIHRFRFFECHVGVFLNVLQCVVVLHLAKRVVQVVIAKSGSRLFLVHHVRDRYSHDGDKNEDDPR